LKRWFAPFKVWVLLALCGLPLWAGAQGVREAWVRRYNGPGNSTDAAIGCAVDSQGNLYVTGYSTGAGTGLDIVTMKYDPNGNLLWIARYNGPVNDDDRPYALRVDSQGNVYITGYSTGATTGWDYITIKYDANGNQLWVARYNGMGNRSDAAYALAIDNQGNVYVTGYSTGVFSRWDYATVKYDANGNRQWVAHYNGLGNQDDIAYGIAVDSQGNVYVTGWSWSGPTPQFDCVTVKYAPNGNLLWVRRYDGAGAINDDAGFAITVDGQGNLYVAGWSWGNMYDYITLKYDPNGTQLWMRRYDLGWDEARRITLDSQGNLYVTGFAGPYYNRDFVTVKYDPNGNLLMTARYGAPGNGIDYADAVALDAQGNIYVTGGSDPDDNPDNDNHDYATVKLDANGNLLWVARYNGPASRFDHDISTALALDGRGNVYVTGYSTGSGTGWDYATVKYVQCPRPCRGNVNGYGVVDDADLLQVLFVFGSTDAEADLNCDGIVDDADLLEVLFNFGNGC
jgi:uncharacterized delta-60 repeat protein